MKRDYAKEEKDKQCNPIFSKLHQTQKFHHHQPPPPPPQSQPTTLLHHSFNLRKCQTSEEGDSHRSPTTTTPTPKTKTIFLPTPSSGNDGATIEVVRRPRGRPPGSKNRPRAPFIITRDAAEPCMSPYILEIPGGVDMLETIKSFCVKRSTGLCIFNASGTVSNITLRQPSTTATPSATATFHGCFDILSLSATILSHPSSSAALTNGGFTISFAGPQGQVVGGAVEGSLFTAGTVYIIAASFNSPSFHRLPLEEDERNSNSASAGGGSEGQHPPSPPTASGGGGGGVESCGGVSLYTCQLPSDVIWVPTARQPSAQHPPPC
ncbi:hypothetical protein ACH5RR_026979 [Cinchona calisaya]|uniref:PPC domain-containing protein n=1 Tax=Cinchona calisaya TaxID=153742 RepID=A0ABD2Z825_9GENT